MRYEFPTGMIFKSYKHYLRVAEMMLKHKGNPALLKWLNSDHAG